MGRSKGGRKWYAVKTGRRPGVYKSWEAAWEHVNGYPGAQYKAFKSRDEAERFVSDQRPVRWWAIKVGRRVGVFRGDWEDIRRHVDGYPGAWFKAFNWEGEARDWLQKSRGGYPPQGYGMHPTLQAEAVRTFGAEEDDDAY